jgi:hypothetical protein
LKRYTESGFRQKQKLPNKWSVLSRPNDISGVVYVQLDGFGGWKIEVAKELKACGYEVMNA